MAHFEKACAELVLSTGRRMRCFGDMMCPGSDGLQYGSDGSVEDGEFTRTERQEIADYFIAKWLSWVSNPPPAERELDVFDYEKKQT